MSITVPGIITVIACCTFWSCHALQEQDKLVQNVTDPFAELDFRGLQESKDSVITSLVYGEIPNRQPDTLQEEGVKEMLHNANKMTTAKHTHGVKLHNANKHDKVTPDVLKHSKRSADLDRDFGDFNDMDNENVMRTISKLYQDQEFDGNTDGNELKLTESTNQQPKINDDAFERLRYHLFHDQSADLFIPAKDNDDMGLNDNERPAELPIEGKTFLSLIDHNRKQTSNMVDDIPVKLEDKSSDYPEPDYDEADIRDPGDYDYDDDMMRDTLNISVTVFTSNKGKGAVVTIPKTSNFEKIPNNGDEDIVNEIKHVYTVQIGSMKTKAGSPQMEIGTSDEQFYIADDDLEI